MEIELWSSADHIIGSAVRGLLVYGFALVAVRVAGRRTIAQLSAFDTVVTIALGSIAAATAVPARASVADGLAVLGVFVSVQTMVGALRQRSSLVRRMTGFAPEVVVRDGAFQMSRSPLSAQMTLQEVQAALRRAGATHVDQVRLAVLEPDGHLSLTSMESDGTLFDERVITRRDADATPPSA